MTSAHLTQEGSYKKIQNYIFNFNDLLGKGNFSKVYKAHHEITNEAVAIKIIELNSLKSKKLQQLLYSQIQILKKLNHPNVVKCHEVFTSNRNCYIILQLCNQGDLQSKFKHKKGLKQHEAQKYIYDIYKGLLYLANNHIVHRDLKVANIFILNGIAKIADFGFAKITKFKFKDINIGSPIYMSPEGLIDNIYGPKTDIWAFGILIYQLLHGETPFSHCKSQKQLKYNISIPISWNNFNKQLSNQIRQVIMKCLEIDQNKRISAFQLQTLPFFYKKNHNYNPNTSTNNNNNNINYNSNPNPHSYPNYNINKNLYKQTKNVQHHHHQWKNIKNSLNNNNNDEGFNKSLDNFIINNNSIKNRIKTQIQFNNNNNNKTKSRQYSGINPSYREHFVRNSVSPSVRYQKQPISYIKITSQQENIRKFHQNSLQKYKTQQTSPILHQNPSKLQLQPSKEHPFKQNIVLSAPITFKQCVNILHYCRLIFKHLILMKQIQFGDENQLNILKRWLSTILKTILKQITDNKIIISQQNHQERCKKLQQVTNQYIKKYTKQLNLNLIKIRLQQSLIINYQKINNYMLSIYQIINQLIQQQNNNKNNNKNNNINTKIYIQLGMSMIIICWSTKIMKDCYQNRWYKNIQKFKDIQEFLVSNKAKIDYNSYLWYKKKFIMEGGSGN